MFRSMENHEMKVAYGGGEKAIEVGMATSLGYPVSLKAVGSGFYTV